MVDYYSTLLRAVTAPGAGDAQWRNAVYDRARRMLSSRLHTLKPAPPRTQIAAEEAALEAAIERIEQELSWTEHGGIAPDARTHDRFGEIGSEPPTAREEGLVASPSRPLRAGLDRRGRRRRRARRRRLCLLGGGLAAIAARQDRRAKQAVAVAGNARPRRSDDLAPGVDGGNSDPDMAYVFRRQPTFYRTLQPRRHHHRR